MTASVAPLMKVVGSVRVPPVQAFPDEAFTRVPCVVAHPDDVEYGTSSAVPAWTAKDIKVAICLLTRGEAGIDTMDPKGDSGVAGT